jgi:hypothetical protein
MNKIIKYGSASLIFIFLIQYLVIFIIFLSNFNANTDKNNLKIHDICKIMIVNFEELILVYYNKSKNKDKLLFKNNDIKNKIHKYLVKYDYYYLLINENSIMCTFFKFKDNHHLIFSGKMTRTNIWEDFNMIFVDNTNKMNKIFNSPFVLYKYENMEFKRIKKNITALESYKIVRSLEHIDANVTYNISSLCYGVEFANLFINTLLSNKINYKLNNYIYEGLTSHDKNIENSNKVNTIYINNNNSFFGLFHKFYKKQQYKILNVNKFELNYKCIMTWYPLKKMFMYLHVYNTLKYYKNNRKINVQHNDK